MRILLPLINLFPKLPRLLLIPKTQPKQHLFPLERMEKRAILIILKRVINLLIPYHASVGGRDVDEFEPEGVADEVVGEDDGALEVGGGPVGGGGVGDVEFGDGDGVDFVGCFGDAAFDGLFVVVGEDRGHFDGFIDGGCLINWWR